ncbi:hypothetical protein MKX03_025131 [Papaver bracteatum]|nr:hypothetical protein MKX03_025131 [Papaver bracteatum]
MNINISIHLILLVHIIISLNLIELALALDRRFENCKPKNCGNGLKISYPFWIEQDYCGYPGFKVTCINEVPRSFHVENSVTYDVCPVPFRNSTFNDRTPFRSGSEVQPLSFFFNCTNFIHHPFYFAWFVPPGKSAYDNLKCQFRVNVPVEALESSLKFEGQLTVNYLPLLKKGFTLEWDKKPCSRNCQASGGYCGVEKNDLVVCFVKVFFNFCAHNFIPL